MAILRAGIMRALLFFLLLLAALPAWAEEAPKLKVGVFDRPPLAMKDADGQWRGLAVDLWEAVAGELGLAYEYVELPLDKMIEKLSRGELDLALGEIGVSSERERMVDFTQPYLVTTAAVAVDRSESFFGLKQVLGGIVRHGLLMVVGVMLGLLFVFSFFLWLVERAVQQTHFGGKPIHGFGSALWFAAVTMTTVGYGDKTPQTPLGRGLAFIWMFLGIVLVSAFTGSVASSITMAELDRSISSVHDLTRFRNGVVGGSLAEEALQAAGIPVQSFPTLEDGVAALKAGRISALIANDAALRYVVRRDAPTSVRIVTFPTLHVTFAMATRPNFAHLQALNVAILDTVDAPDWQRQVQRWLGPPVSR
jgi:polar amino acid transport system substrate-binding protein